MSMLLFGGILLAAFANIYFVLLIGIVLFSLTTLFSFVTLPVEFDASNRAMAWLTTNGMVVGGESGKAKDALNWAAKTYVINALASLATLLYYDSIFLGRDD